MCGVCNVCVCEGFVMCGCFGNMYTVLWLRFFLTWQRFFLTLTEVLPCFFLSCKANARVKLAKTGHGPHSSTLVLICVVRLLFVLFHALFVCKCVLPPGDNPIAVNKYTIYNSNMFQPLKDHLQPVLLSRHTLHAAQYQSYTLKITLSRSKQVGLSYSVNDIWCTCCPVDITTTHIALP